jgi:hypothetical protein
MNATKSCVFRFADVTVREREFAIAKAGKAQQVEPKAFQVLLILIRDPNRLITKEELLNSVWADATVTENSLARKLPCCGACWGTTRAILILLRRCPRSGTGHLGGKVLAWPVSA